VEAELLVDLTGHRELRGLTHLDHAAGQVPVVLVGQLAQQHPRLRRRVADQHLADRPLARQERVEQRPEAARLVHGHVVDQPGVDDDVAVRPPLHPLAPQARPGRDPLSLVVVYGHQRLDPLVVDESGGHVPSYDVDGGLPATLGQHRGPADPGDPVGHGRDMRVGLGRHGDRLDARH
jgi:hypothetical protein